MEWKVVPSTVLLQKGRKNNNNNNEMKTLSTWHFLSLELYFVLVYLMYRFDEKFNLIQFRKLLLSFIYFSLSLQSNKPIKIGRRDGYKYWIDNSFSLSHRFISILCYICLMCVSFKAKSVSITIIYNILCVLMQMWSTWNN